MNTMLDTKHRVSSVNETVVRLSCLLPDGNAEVEVPISFIPNESAHYGAPVWVSVDTNGGLRRLRVSARSDINPPDLPADINEINAWLTSGDCYWS